MDRLQRPVDGQRKIGARELTGASHRSITEAPSGISAADTVCFLARRWLLIAQEGS